MKDVFIFIPITSKRFISITCARSSEPANCGAKQYQWHFKGIQGAFDGILMLLCFFFFLLLFWGVGGFRGWHRQSATLVPDNNDRTGVTDTAAEPGSFFRVLAQKFKKNDCTQLRLESLKSLTDDSKADEEVEWRGKGQIFPQVWHPDSF